jgi:ABC-type nitrate/sulfonate/bicarbonate transport system permease component
MRQDIVGSEWIGRGLQGIWMTIVAVRTLHSGRRRVAAIAAIAGIGLIQNAAMTFCGRNWLFNIDSIDK